MQSCMSDVKAWVSANMLKFNYNKTELMLVTSKIAKHFHNLHTSNSNSNAQTPFKRTVKNIGLTLDCDLFVNLFVFPNSMFTPLLCFFIFFYERAMSSPEK